MQKQLIALLVLTSLVFGSWGITRLTNNQPMKLRGSLRVSPDGKYIASLGARNYSPPELLLLANLETGEEQQIHAFAYGPSEITWSGDGKNILYRDYDYLFNYNLETNEHTNILDADFGKYSPVGNKLAYLKDSTVYVRDLDTGLDTIVYHKQFRRITLIDWPQNSKDYLYIVEQISSDGYTKKLLSIRLSDLLVKEIYTTARNDDYVVGLGLTRNDYQFNSFIENNEQKIVIAECNPHNGNEKDSIWLYNSIDDSLKLLVDYQNLGGVNTGFLAPKWSMDGKSFVVQYGTELIDYGSSHTIFKFDMFTGALITDIIPSVNPPEQHNYFSDFMNPVPLDSNRFAFISTDSSDPEIPLDIYIADRTVSITETQPLAKSIIISSYPNPFNPSTTIKFDLPVNSLVKLAVYNVAGRQVAVLANGLLNGGTHSMEFNGARLASGVYFYQLEAEGKIIGRNKMMLFK